MLSGQANEVPPSDAIEALNKLLLGKRLAHFHVGLQFTLYFGNYVGGPDRPIPPIEVAVSIDSDFWINDKSEWDKKIAGVSPSVVEPDIPIKAYELARLCWVDDTEVIRIAEDAKRVIVTLKNGETISISEQSEEYAEFAFLVGDDVDETRSTFSICCIDGVFFTSRIDFLADASWSAR